MSSSSTHCVANKRQSLIDKRFANSRRQIYELIGLRCKICRIASLWYLFNSVLITNFSHTLSKSSLMVRILTSGSGFVLITKIRKRPVIGERKYKLCLADVHGGEMNAWRMNPKRRLRGGYSTNTLSVEFAAKSFFPISPKIKKKKKTDSRRRMYFGAPVDAVFQPYV